MPEMEECKTCYAVVEHLSMSKHKKWHALQAAIREQIRTEFESTFKEIGLTWKG